MAVRETKEDFLEDVEKAFSGVAVPATTKREVITRLSEVAERYISPYPHPDVLRQINELAPGSAAKIVDVTVDTIRSQNELDQKELELKSKELDVIANITNRDFSNVSEGRIFGFIAFIALLIFAGTMYYIGAHELAYAGLAASLVGIITQIIRGGKSVTIERVAQSEEAEDTSQKQPQAITDERRTKKKK